MLFFCRHESSSNVWGLWSTASLDGGAEFSSSSSLLLGLLSSHFPSDHHFIACSFLVFQHNWQWLAVLGSWLSSSLRFFCLDLGQNVRRLRSRSSDDADEEEEGEEEEEEKEEEVDSSLSCSRCASFLCCLSNPLNQRIHLILIHLQFAACVFCFVSSASLCSPVVSVHRSLSLLSSLSTHLVVMKPSHPNYSCASLCCSLTVFSSFLLWHYVSLPCTDNMTLISRLERKEKWRERKKRGEGTVIIFSADRLMKEKEGVKSQGRRGRWVS